VEQRKILRAHFAQGLAFNILWRRINSAASRAKLLERHNRRITFSWQAGANLLL
jgi:hypothetical protein